MNPLLRFMLIAGSLYLVWLFGYEHYLAIDGRLDAALTQNIATAGAAVLRLIGFDAMVSKEQANLILLSSIPAVKIGYYCDGLVLYALFTGFVLAFPGPIRHKLWFIPMGIALIYGINILRVAALCLNHIYWHQTVDFNHHYTFTFIVYGFIFMLWIWWATRLASKASINSAQHVHA